MEGRDGFGKIRFARKKEAGGLHEISSLFISFGARTTP
ncbi:MAG: hypothetical protein ACJAT6_000568 [Akkermansiaceae bacterium]|jgi:hypothetical protein